MSLPGGGTWTYGYVPQSAAGIPLGIMPKDDPNSIAPNLSSITDDQNRRIDMWMSSDGATLSSVTNEVYDVTNPNNPVLVSYCQTDNRFVTSATDPNGFYKRGWLQEKSNAFHYQDANNLWHTRLLVQNDYAYDNAGQKLNNQISSLDSTTGNPTSRTELYGYDELNRLTSVNYGDGQTQGYTFDQMGNRLTKTDNSTGNENYVVNAADMLTSRTTGGTTSAYTNDADGNTLTGGGRTNTWDSQNRLTKCVNGTNTSTFTYGSDGIRHSSVVNGVTTDFVLDASMFVRELHNGLVKATYFMGASGPAYRRDDANGGTVRWYLHDGLGSVLGEVDPNGNITARRKYDVYGGTRTGSDAGTSKHKFVGRLGHPSEDETGLIYMQARYMDPQIGRFTNEDPALQGTNWFNYCNNNPVSYVDPDGKDWKLSDAITKTADSLGWTLILAGVAAILKGTHMISAGALMMMQGFLLEMLGPAISIYVGEALALEGVGKAMEVQGGRTIIAGVMAIAGGLILLYIGEYIFGVDGEVGAAVASKYGMS